jgi:uncharacterized cupredoxin-like copper-binding protein
LPRVRLALALVALGTVGAAAPFAIPAIGAGSSTSSASKIITIKVSASEFKFALSRRSVPTGTTVIFKVTNKGKIQHDFKIAGKKTKLLAPAGKAGSTATLKVVFKKKGRFGFLCTVKGHAAIGMKGTFSVGVKAVTTTTTTTTSTSTTSTTTSTGGGSTCTTPTTTVNVSMVEYRFDLDKSSVPAGCVQFVIKNNGQVQHNFDIVGVKAGAILSPAATETWAVQLGAGGKSFTCDVPFHESFGMTGVLTVT